MAEPVLLIDGGMVAFAAWHALKGKVRWPLTFQIPRMIRAQVGERGEPYAIVWNPERLWKQTLWPRYQAGRPEIWDLAGREDYRAALRVLTALGAVQYRTRDLESDEVLAALVHRLAGRERVVLISDDKDFFQLLSGSVRMRGRVRGEVRARDVRRILGVGPSYVADWLALTGDATDGIPRIVSDVAALRLLRTRGHVRDWIDRRLRLGPSLARRLDAGREQLRINLELVDLSPAAVESRGAPGAPLLAGWGDLAAARRLGRRATIAWLQADDLATAWAPLKRGGERARGILGV